MEKEEYRKGLNIRKKGFDENFKLFYSVFPPTFSAKTSYLFM